MPTKSVRYAHRRLRLTAVDLVGGAHPTIDFQTTYTKRLSDQLHLADEIADLLREELLETKP